MRKLLAGSVAVVGLLVAQTTVRVNMISGPTGGGRVMVLAPNGNVTFASIGAGITLVDTGGGAWVLQSQATAAGVGEAPVRQPDGSYLIARPPLPGTLRVYRNGLRQKLDADYRRRPADAVLPDLPADHEGRSGIRRPADDQHHRPSGLLPDGPAVDPTPDGRGGS